MFREEPVSVAQFPAWHYVKIQVGQQRRIAAVIHSETAVGPIPFWYDDPDHPQRALPLLKSMNPIDLGDYGTILHRGSNMEIFIALCRLIDDLPEPLVAVQCISWLNDRNLFRATYKRLAVRCALYAVQKTIKNRRDEFDAVMRKLA